MQNPEVAPYSIHMTRKQRSAEADRKRIERIAEAQRRRWEALRAAQGAAVRERTEKRLQSILDRMAQGERFDDIFRELIAAAEAKEARKKNPGDEHT